MYSARRQAPRDGHELAGRGFRCDANWIQTQFYHL